MNAATRPRMVFFVAALLGLVVGLCCGCSSESGVSEVAAAIVPEKSISTDPTQTRHVAEAPPPDKASAEVGGAPAQAAAPPPTAEARAKMDVSWETVLDRKRQFEGAVSTGTTLKGRLRGGGVQLPHDGKHHTILEVCRERKTNFATEEVVALLTDTAAAVAKDYPESPKLVVCNMSKEGGGNIPWSRSHNSGRDVDIAFFTRTKSDVPVESPRLIRFGRSLLSLGDEGEYLFDVERNWAVAKHLMTHPTIPVQWIFVYKPLKRAMLRHAKAKGEPAALLEKAEQILWQPSDSSRHHDHFHVRIFCPASDRAEGCLNQHPVWPWIAYDPEPLANRGAALAPAMTHKDEAIRVRMLDHIDDTYAYDAAPALAEMAIFDPNYELRLRALNILVEWHKRDPDVIFALESLIRMPGEGLVKDGPYTTVSERISTDGVITRHTLGKNKPRNAMVLRRAWHVLFKMGSPFAGPFLARALKSTRVIESTNGAGTSEARLAAKAALHSMDLRVVPALIDALSHDDRRVRANARLALRRVTNHTYRKTEEWRTWWDENRHKTRDEVLIAGFRRSGIKIFELDNKGYVDTLVPLTKREDEIGYNADRLLNRITGRFVPREASATEKHKRWSAMYPEK